MLFFLPLFAQQLPAQSPQITNGGIVNAASYARPTVLAPGLVFSLFGTSFTDGTSASAAAGVPLPTRLAGARVLVNGIAAPLFAVSPVQIDAQFPVELSDLSSATIEVEVQTTAGTVISPGINVDVAPVSPGIFTLNAIGSGSAYIVRTSDGSQICPRGRSDCTANPAIPGEVVTVYMTGLGAVNGPWFSGQPATTMLSTVTAPAVTIAGKKTPVLFSGLLTSSVGVYRVDVAVPDNVPAGDSVAVIASIGGKTSNQATIAIGAATANAPWGGGPPGGSITTIAIDPLNHYTLYAVTQKKFIKSTNGGASWIPLGSGLPTSAIRFLTIDAHNSSVMYAGGSGMFRSTDGGITWSAINRGLDPSLNFTSLAIDPINPSTLYVVTINTGAPPRNISDGSFLFKSTDGGEHWTALTRGLPTLRPNMLVAIDPRDSAVLYAAGETAVAQDCFFQSINAGASWSLTGCAVPSTFIQNMQDLIVDPNHTGTLYVRSVFGVFKSVDKGRSWSAVYSRTTADISSLVMSLVTPSTLYFATRTGLVFKSIDGGENWTAGASISIDIKRDLSCSLVVDPINPATLYAATAKGISRSVDGGANWSEASNGITGTVVSALTLDRSSPANLYVGTRSGAFKSIDGGASWSAISSGLAIFVRTFVFDPTNSAIAYAGIGGSADNDGVYKSTDGGATWTAIWGGRSHGAHALAINPLNTAVLFVVSPSNGAFKSADAGATWTPMTLVEDVADFAFDPINPTTVYAAGSSGVLKSTDAGTSWTMSGDGLPQGCCSSVVIDPSSPTTLYALGRDIFKSMDGGASWSALNTDFSGGKPPILPTTLAVDPSSPNTLYAGTNYGIFKSTDAGKSWSAASDGLTSLNISALVIDSSSPSRSSTLFAGTNGAGVFRSTDGGTTWQPTSANLN